MYPAWLIVYCYFIPFPHERVNFVVKLRLFYVFSRIILPVAEVAASTWHQYPNHSAQVAMPTVQPIQQKPVIDEKELELQVRNYPIYVLSASHRNFFCSGFKQLSSLSVV